MDHWTDWFPAVFMAFKIIVLFIGAYFAIKWHFDRDREEREKAAELRREKLAAAREAAQN
ncbi:MAG: hypothetical protein AAGI92_08425 [Pseudomonadota bacterium]